MKKTMKSEAKPATEKAVKKAAVKRIKKAVQKTRALPPYCGYKNPFTPEAWEYVNREDLWPGTEKALCFLQPSLIFDIANGQRRTIDLDQVKFLVHPEGPPAEMCALLKAKVEERFFTPLSYAYAISLKGKDQLEKGTPLSEIKGIFRGGPYYVNKAKTEAKAFSGSPLRFNPATKCYWRNKGSSLVIIAEQKGSEQDPVWGVPFGEIDNVINAQARKAELNTIAAKMAADLTNGRENRGWNRIGDHFPKRSKLKERPRRKQHSTEEVD